MILPSNHSVPPTATCSGISWLVHGLSNYINSSKYKLKLLSVQKGTSAVSPAAIRYEYQNITLGIFFKMLVWLLKYLPYHLKRRIFFSANEEKVARCLLLAWRARFIKNDIVVAHVYPTLVKALHLLGIPKNKVIFYFHTSDYATMPSDVLKFLNNYCKGLITIAKESITPNIFSKPVQHILNAVEIQEKSNPSAIELNITPDDFAIIYAGQIVASKGVRELILAVQPLIEADAKIKLFIAGRIPDTQITSIHYLNELKELAGNYAENIIFTGYLPHQELEQLYRQFKLGVLLSQEREGNSLFLMECIASGVPVLASNIGGISLVVDDGVTGFLVNDPKDITNLRHQLYQLIYNRELYNRLKANCVAASRQKFSFQRAAHEFEQFVDQLN